MKTIKEAAQEYSGRIANKIKTTWTNEREAAFHCGAAFAQRWIPVEEELPELDIDDQLPCAVIGRTKRGHCSIHELFSRIDIVRLKENCVEWRPITLK